MKKIASSLFTVIVAVLLSGRSVDAHVGDYHAGGYLPTAPSQPSYLMFMYSSSSTGGYYTGSVFGSITDWNGISSNVTVSMDQQAPGMPSNITNQFYHIYNETMTNEFDNNAGLLGFVHPIDASGTKVSMDSNWYKVSIYLNTTSYYITSSSVAKGVFLHEVGHCLKLAHPIQSFYYHGTDYNGVPYAVMNSGTPYTNNASALTIQVHDMDNLRGKWGN